MSPWQRPSDRADRRTRPGCRPAGLCGRGRRAVRPPASSSEVASARGSSSARSETLMPAPTTSASSATSPRMPAHLRPSISTSLGHFSRARHAADTGPGPARSPAPARAPVQPRRSAGICRLRQQHREHQPGAGRAEPVPAGPAAAGQLLLGGQHLPGVRRSPAARCQVGVRRPGDDRVGRSATVAVAGRAVPATAAGSIGAPRIQHVGRKVSAAASSSASGRTPSGQHSARRRSAGPGGPARIRSASAPSAIGRHRGNRTEA